MQWAGAQIKNLRYRHWQPLRKRPVRAPGLQGMGIRAHILQAAFLNAALMRFQFAEPGGALPDTEASRWEFPRSQSGWPQAKWPDNEYKRIPNVPMPAEESGSKFVAQKQWIREQSQKFVPLNTGRQFIQAN